jgi:hypothetical protein
LGSPRSSGATSSERREAGQPSGAHDLFAVAAEFDHSAVDALQTVLACYEAMRATEDSLPDPATPTTRGAMALHARADQPAVDALGVASMSASNTSPMVTEA